jgi:glycosyltransferase involved in cell wall biosynthesis
VREGTRPARFELTLGVVSHVPHWAQENGQPLAYEPYVREMEVWAKLFARVNVCAPVAEWSLRGNEAPYSARNIRWLPVRYSHGPGVHMHVRRLRQLAVLSRTFVPLIRNSDLILLRSPTPVSMIARPMARAFGAPTITKWAGPLEGCPDEAPLTRIERLLVRRGHGPALVYGRSDRRHLISFLPALMSEAELERARDATVRRAWTPPWRILAVGRLSPEKGFDLALRGLAELRRRRCDLAWSFTLVGDGTEARALKALSDRLGISDRVTFAGALSFAAVQERYAESHVVVVPGVNDGWPQVIGEAWAHSAIPVAAAGGVGPDLIDGTGSGVTFTPTPEDFAGVLSALLSDPPEMRAMAALGPRQCANLSLEAFAARLERVVVDRCGLS